MKRIKIGKIGISFAMIPIMCACLVSCGGISEKVNSTSSKNQEEIQSTAVDSWQQAENTPLGRYPELVTYTLGKQVDSNYSNMPEGDTYEDNNYTRYLRKVLNVQNDDVLEGQDSMQYEQLEFMAVMEEKIPDVMIVTNKEMLDYLVKKDMIADLTAVYEKCTSERIKEMYASYGNDKLGSATYDGKLMAFPETEVYQGPALIWLRKDWMEQLGLDDPESLEDALRIIQEFHEKNPGQNPEGNIGLALDPVLVDKTDQCFSVSPILDTYHAYPEKWIPKENGELVYGSVMPEMKQVLSCLHELYENGVLDPDFMIRNAKNLPELLADGRSGAFFGWWWAPNAPLFNIYDGNDNWQPYVVAASKQYETTLSYGRHYYVVVRKGYEHPEIVPKILTALYDYARYDGKADAKEVGEYLGSNVGPEATPLNINLDYSDITFRVTRNLQAVEAGELGYNDLTVLEQGYWNSYNQYHANGVRNATVWAAYSSRMNAVAKLEELTVTYLNEGYTSYVDQLYSEELKKMEEKTFLQIITGEKPVDYFDTFVEQWYEDGGKELTESANTYFSKNEK